MFGKHQVHHSHRCRYLRGYLYCNRCGALTKGARIVLLKKQCRGMPASPAYKYMLNRARGGYNPYGKGKPWPVRADRFAKPNWLP